MGETKLSEALNLYEAIVLKMVHCFKAFDIVKNGDICWPSRWSCICMDGLNLRPWRDRHDTSGPTAVIIFILFSKACIVRIGHFKWSEQLNSGRLTGTSHSQNQHDTSVMRPRLVWSRDFWRVEAMYRNVSLRYFCFERSILCPVVCVEFNITEPS